MLKLSLLALAAVGVVAAANAQVAPPVKLKSATPVTATRTIAPPADANTAGKAGDVANLRKEGVGGTAGSTVHARIEATINSRSVNPISISRDRALN